MPRTGTSCTLLLVLLIVLPCACDDELPPIQDGGLRADRALVADSARPSDGPAADGPFADDAQERDLAARDAAVRDAGPPAPDGATTGALTCSGYTMPPFSKGCLKPVDCAVVMHQTDCCGNTLAVGVNASVAADFKIEEKQCAATYPGCGCPSGPPMTEDGSTASFNGEIGVACVANACTTYVAACGGVCEGPLVCLGCATTTGPDYALCTTTCTGDVDCKDAARPSCVPGLYGTKFCAPAGTTCNNTP